MFVSVEEVVAFFWSKGLDVFRSAVKVVVFVFAVEVLVVLMSVMGVDVLVSTEVAVMLVHVV